MKFKQILLNQIIEQKIHYLNNTKIEYANFWILTNVFKEHGIYPPAKILMGFCVFCVKKIKAVLNF